ncbi:MAG TPA: diacylglycerol kinase family protein [Bacteroidales bacterium]|nr:diacylglycerol kinase family protein [Bacteroidales bacterium]HPI68681.1 diacylglycerol kinase family protein [Bacteroidales bacterium]
MKKKGKTGIIGSFACAFKGLLVLVKEERNALIQLVLLILVVVLGIVLNISKGDWLYIIIVSGFVVTSECFNTAVENLSDIITREQDERIKKIKDLAAGGVLIAAIAAAITGLLVFVPELKDVFSS